jgi:DNA polymerase (family 10)
MPEVTRDLLVNVLEDLAQLLELKGETPFKIRTFRKGAEVASALEGDLVQRARDRDLKGIDGIGESLQDKLHELALTGRLEIHDSLRSEFPEGLFEILELKCLDCKKVRTLHKEMGIDSLGALKGACQSGKVEALAGFGKKGVEKILGALSERERLSGRFVRADVAAAAERIVGLLRSHPDVSHAEVVGSYRRNIETVNDLQFLVATKKPNVVTEFFTEIEEIHQVILQCSSKAAVRLRNGLPCDLRAVSPTQWPFALLNYTGSKEHILELRSRALKQGFKLNEHHLAPVDGETWNDSTETFEEEADIYAALGLSYIEPEFRENIGEFVAADKGEMFCA